MSIDNKYVRLSTDAQGVDVIEFNLAEIRKDYVGIVLGANPTEDEIAAAINAWETKQAEKEAKASIGGTIMIAGANGDREYSYLKKGAKARPAEKLVDATGFVSKFIATKDASGKVTKAGTVHITMLTQVNGVVQSETMSRYVSEKMAQWFPTQVGQAVSISGSKAIAFKTTFLGVPAAGQTIPADAQTSELNGEVSVTCFHAGDMVNFSCNVASDEETRKVETLKAAVEQQDADARERAKQQANAETKGEEIASLAKGFKPLTELGLSSSDMVTAIGMLLNRK